MEVLEGLWDCAQCKTTGIAGGLHDCPNCGEPQNSQLDPSERFYLGESPRVIDTSVEGPDPGPNWNCGHCGESNAGTQSNCRKCGQPRSGDDTVEPTGLYLDHEMANGVTFDGPDQSEKDWVDRALQNADPLQQLEEEPVRSPERVYSTDELPRQGDSLVSDLSDSDTEYDDSDDGPTDLSPPAVLDRYVESPVKRLLADPAKRRLTAIIALVVALLGGSAAGGSALYDNYIATEPVNLTVKSMYWQRELEVEILKTFRLEDWSYPADAYNITSRTAIRTYRQVLDHYETRYRTVYDRKRTGSHSESYSCGTEYHDMGNGRFERTSKTCYRTVDDYQSVPRQERYDEPVYRSEPVYDTLYTYNVDRWVTDHFEKADGRFNPHDPVINLSNPKQRIGDERHETYDVVLVDPKMREFDRKLDQVTWSKLSEGTVLIGDETKHGAIRKVHWPS